MTAEQFRIHIAKDFSRTPGPRKIVEGEFSGEAFLAGHLRPKYIEARQRRIKLLIDLDGAAGYATSFLDGAFGGLAREFPPAEVIETLTFKCEDEPDLPNEIKQFITDARL